jgi:hypothetical protein
MCPLAPRNRCCVAGRIKLKDGLILLDGNMFHGPSSTRLLNWKKMDGYFAELQRWLTQLTLEQFA